MRYNSSEYRGAINHFSWNQIMSLLNPFQPCVGFHVETSQLIYRASDWFLYSKWANQLEFLDFLEDGVFFVLT